MQSPIVDALIGATSATIGGIISYTSLYPLENIRTRLQVASTVPSHVQNANQAQQPPPKQNTLAFIYDIYKRHGIEAFYGGLGSGIFGIAVSNSVYFYWYSFLKRWVISYRRFFNKSYGRSLSTWDNIIVAALAGCINITFTNPIWVVNTRMMLQSKDQRQLQKQKVIHDKDQLFPKTTNEIAKVTHSITNTKAEVENAIIQTLHDTVEKAIDHVEATANHHLHHHSVDTDNNANNNNSNHSHSSSSSSPPPSSSSPPTCELQDIIQESSTELRKKIEHAITSSDINIPNTIQDITNAVNADVHAHSKTYWATLQRVLSQILQYIKQIPSNIVFYVSEWYNLIKAIILIIKQQLMIKLGYAKDEDRSPLSFHTRFSHRNGNHNNDDDNSDDDNPFFYHSLLDGIAKMLQCEGFTSLYKGYFASIVLVLNPTIQFVLYDQIVAWMLNRKNRNSPSHEILHLSSFEYFAISAFTKAIATIATYPYQVVKSRQQQVHKDVNSNDNKEESCNMQSLSMYETMIQMKNQEGYSVFVNGLGAKLLQTVSNAALTSMIQERVHRTIADTILSLLSSKVETQ